MVPPSCLASFGFGGTVVTMFPKRKLRLNNAGSSFRNSPRMPMFVMPFVLIEFERNTYSLAVCFTGLLSLITDPTESCARGPLACIEWSKFTRKTQSWSSWNHSRVR